MRCFKGFPPLAKLVLTRELFMTYTKFATRHCEDGSYTRSCKELQGVHTWFDDIVKNPVALRRGDLGSSGTYQVFSPSVL